MCGIAGILRTDRESKAKKTTIKNMISTLSHRGPDGWGFYLSNEIALGHTRLSIIDLAGGHQPMVSGKYVIAFNGEIYNYIELREELIAKGVTFKTQSDTEVIIKSFEVYGPDSISMLNGPKS